MHRFDRVLDRVAFLVLGILILSLPACLELDEQRITLHHDEATDTLYILLHYDGIHEVSGGMFQGASGANQIAGAVAEGDFMFLDWFGHMPLGELIERAYDQEPPGELRDLRPLLGLIKKNLSTRILGRTRDLDGHHGAVQLVEVREATLVFEEINRLLNAHILASDKPDIDLVATWIRAREAATGGWQWFQLEGDALTVKAPIYPHEWARVKADFLHDLIEPSDSETEEKQRLVGLFAGMPFAYEEGGGKVRFRVGDPELPVPMRFKLNDAYNAKLEEPLARHVPVDLDEVLARYLVEGTFPKIELPPPDHENAGAAGEDDEGDGEDAEKSETAVIARAAPPLKEDVDRLLAWGPPEERVRVLIRWIESVPVDENGKPDPGVRAEREKRALERLAEWAATRDANDPHPPCPGEEGGLEGWKAWYRAVTEFAEE